MSEPKSILFIDFDGTLCHDRFWRGLEPELKSKVQAYFFGSKKEIVKDWMLGRYTSEEINHILATELDIEYELLWSTFVNDCEKMTVPSDILNKINDLRKKYVTVLITDNMDCFSRFTVPALGLSKCFDLISNSFEQKCLKNDNDGALFKKIAITYNALLSNSILLDNSESSCRVFEDLGGKSCLVTKEKPVENWLNYLTEINDILEASFQIKQGLSHTGDIKKILL